MHSMIFMFCLLTLAASSGIHTTRREESSDSGSSGGHGVYGGGGHGYSPEDELKHEDNGLEDFDFGGDWNGLDLDFVRFHLGGGSEYFGGLSELGVHAATWNNMLGGWEDHPEVGFRSGTDGQLSHGYDTEQSKYPPLGYPHPVGLLL